MKTEPTAGIPALALAFKTSLLTTGRRTVDIREGLHIEPAAPTYGSDNSISQLARSLFFGSAQRLSATLGRIHPHLPKGQIHPSTSAGLKSLIVRLKLGRPRPVREITAETLEGSAAIFGGPVANLHARFILGCGGASPLLGIVPPVTFDCLSSLGEALELRTEPWTVIVDGRRSEKECLVVTSLPMDHTDDRLAIFSGLHGAGTRAIDLVLKDESLLEKLYRDTRSLLAWQAIIEVHAKDDETPNAIGDFRMFEISGIDFDKQKKNVRDSLFLEQNRIKQLVDLVPTKEEVDLSDPDNTGVIILRDHKLWKRRQDDMIPNGSSRQPVKSSAALKPQHQSHPRGLIAPPARLGTVRGPRQSDEASMDLVPSGSPTVPKRGPGRPPKEKSDATLTHRLQILLSSEDIEQLKALMGRTAAASMGEAIRNAVRKDFERLMAKPRSHRK